jgi:hypothetical protein
VGGRPSARRGAGGSGAGSETRSDAERDREIRGLLLTALESIEAARAKLEDA